MYHDHHMCCLAGLPVRMLLEQYRMDPTISRFPSQRFYGGLLQVW